MWGEKMEEKQVQIGIGTKKQARSKLDARQLCVFETKLKAGPFAHSNKA